MNWINLQSPVIDGPVQPGWENGHIVHLSLQWPQSHFDLSLVLKSTSGQGGVPSHSCFKHGHGGFTLALAQSSVNFFRLNVFCFTEIVDWYSTSNQRILNIPLYLSNLPLPVYVQLPQARISAWCFFFLFVCYNPYKSMGSCWTVNQTLSYMTTITQIQSHHLALWQRRCFGWDRHDKVLTSHRWCLSINESFQMFTLFSGNSSIWK